jgi:hypothetical protein
VQEEMAVFQEPTPQAEATQYFLRLLPQGAVVVLVLLETRLEFLEVLAVV